MSDIISDLMMNAELLDKFLTRRRKLAEDRDIVLPGAPISVFDDLTDQELDWGLAQALLATDVGDDYPF